MENNLVKKENHGITILKQNYYIIMKHIDEANREMIAYPNEHSNNVLNEFKPILNDIKDCLDKLGCKL